MKNKWWLWIVFIIGIHFVQVLIREINTPSKYVDAFSTFYELTAPTWLDVAIAGYFLVIIIIGFARGKNKMLPKGKGTVKDSPVEPLPPEEWTHHPKG